MFSSRLFTALTFFFGTTAPLWAKGLKDIEKFFSASGTIVAQSGNNTYICNRGLPYFKPSFPVAIYRGAYVKDPSSGKEIFVIVKEVGKGKVVSSFPTNSVISVEKNNGVKIGDTVRLDYRTVCFFGSDYTFKELSQTLPVVKVKNPSTCRWTVRETPGGYEVYLDGKEVYFSQKELPSYAVAPQAVDLRDIHILVRKEQLKDFDTLPTSVDSQKVGNTDFVAVSFEDGVAIYQKVGNNLVKLAYLPTPVGTIVGVQLFELNGNLYIIGNAFTSDAEPVAFIAKMVGTNPVVIKDSIPYYIAVLNKNDPKGSFVAQTFDNGFKPEVYRLHFENDRLSLGKRIQTLPKDFRADTAVVNGDGELAYITTDGVLKVLKGSLDKGFKEEISVEGEFGKSYNSIKLPFLSGGLGKVYFPPRPVPIQIFGFKGFLVAENIPRKIVPILADKFEKFEGGRLVFVAKNRKGFYEKKKLMGAIFTDDVQGLTLDGSGYPLLLSGKVNPFIFRSGGSLYRLEFKYY